MGIYQRNLGAAMADNVITPQESEVLAGNLGRNSATHGTTPQQFQQLQQQPQQVKQSPPVTESLGIDRHRIMGIPVGPKLTLDQSLPKSSDRLVSIESSATGTQDQLAVQEAAHQNKPPRIFSEV